MEALKELRKKANKTQSDIANYLKLQTMTYNGYENGKHEPSIDTLKKLADFYGTSVDYLVGHETPGVLDLGYLNEDQKTAVKMLTKLNQMNFVKAFSYISGLYVEQ